MAGKGGEYLDLLFLFYVVWQPCTVSKRAGVDILRYPDI